MKRRYRIIGLVVVVLIIGCVIYSVMTSNLLVSRVTATFSPGENDLNQLEITAPYGWYILDYYKTQTSFSDPDFHVAGFGRGATQLYGPNTSLANYYPDEGTVTVPFDQPTQIYEAENKHYELYVIITQNPDKYDYLKSQ